MADGNVMNYEIGLDIYEEKCCGHRIVYKDALLKSYSEFIGKRLNECIKFTKELEYVEFKDFGTGILHQLTPSIFNGVIKYVVVKNNWIVLCIEVED